MLLKSIYFLTLLLGVPCCVTRSEKTGIISNSAEFEAENDSNILPDGYIAFGRRVQIGEFPWMTSIDTRGFGSSQCGGSLISDRHVLTAAHCVIRARRPSDVTITVGDYTRNSFPKDCDIQKRCTMNHRTQAERIISHDKFDTKTISNDIALLKLAKHVNTGVIRPISLPPFDVDDPKYENAPLTVAGWGYTEIRGQPLSSNLLATEVNLKTRQQCYKIYNYLYPNGHLCAGKPEKQASACNGDSGGPLMMYYKNKIYLSGIVSFSWDGLKCGVRKANYYVNVFKYMKWIDWAKRQY